MPLYSSWIHGVTARQGVADPAAVEGIASLTSVFSMFFGLFFWRVTKRGGSILLGQVRQNPDYSHECISWCLLAIIGYIGTRVHQATRKKLKGKTYSKICGFS
jgi:hypothetical protein